MNKSIISQRTKDFITAKSLTDPLPQNLTGTHVTNTRGIPLVVYRGEHGPEGVSRRGSLSFGSHATANTYAQSPNDFDIDGSVVHTPRVLAAHLSIKNPVINRPNDSYMDMSEIEAIVGRKKAERMALDMSDDIVRSDHWNENFAGYDGPEDVAGLLRNEPDRLGELPIQVHKVFDSPKYVSWFRKSGYDGAIHGGSGANAFETEYKIFHPSQAFHPVTGEPLWSKHSLGGI